MIDEQGLAFEATIKAFSLAVPHMLH
jgi:uncharacterized protein affecting Mg2+/Co2+ transport